MKFTALIISLTIVSAANATVEQTTVARVSQGEMVTPPQRRFDLALIGARTFSNEHSTPLSDLGLELGYFLSGHLEVAAGVGMFTSGTRRQAGGGSLADWQYIENESELKGQFLMAEVRYWFTDSVSKSRGFFLGGGLENLWSTARYEYGRYKPYNGAICIGTCTKALEESTSGESGFSTAIARVSAGYAIELGQRGFFENFSLLVGASYLHVLNPQEIEVGTVRKSRVGTDLIGPVMANAALTARF